MLESILRDSVLKHLNSQQLISQHQHGFVSGKSCLTNLLETFERITDELDQGNCPDMIYLDYRKAFDSVPHKRLIYKLGRYGIRGKVLDWFECLLTNRKQKVTVRGQSSSTADVFSGVPQGSVVGPLLFILYVNELPESLVSDFKMFADDSKIFNNSENFQVIQEDLNTLQEWSNKWLLKFNPDKCKTIHFGTANPNHTYTLNNTELDSVDKERDLGVIITKDRKPSQQCATAARKATQSLWMLRRNFKTY